MEKHPIKKSFPQLRVGQNLFLGVLWVGVAFAIAGLSVRIITETWSNIAVALLILGLLAIACILLLRWRFGPPSQYQVSWWRRRSLQSSANAFIATTAVVMILCILNIIAVRYGSQIDLTEAQQFSLAPQTQELLGQLSDPLKVWSFTEAPDPNERTLLEKYRQINPENFQFEFVNPQLQPGIANRFEITSSNQIVLDYQNRKRVLERPVNESELTPALLALVSNIQAKIYFLEGHGEVPLTGSDINLQSAAAVLNQASFTLIPLNLVQQPRIPADANVLVIAGPKRPFIESEINMIEAYLDDGGRLLAMLDPQLKTGLETILKARGIVLDHRIIVDVSRSGETLELGPAVPVVVNYGNHPISQDFGRGFSYYPLAQSIQIEDAVADQVVPILISQERTWAEANPDSEQLAFDPTQDRQGPLNLGVAFDASLTNTEEAAGETPKTSGTRIVVIGDSDFATSGPFEQGLNGDVFLNSVSWLAENKLNLSIRPKEQVERRLDIPPRRFRVLALVAIALLPLLALTIAGTIWWKRR